MNSKTRFSSPRYLEFAKHCTLTKAEKRADLRFYQRRTRLAATFYGRLAAICFKLVRFGRVNGNKLLQKAESIQLK